MVLRYAHVNVAHAAPSIDKMPAIAPSKDEISPKRTKAR
jgi:hypothetical protein